MRKRTGTLVPLHSLFQGVRALHPCSIHGVAVDMAAPTGMLHRAQDSQPEQTEASAPARVESQFVTVNVAVLLAAETPFPSVTTTLN